MHESQHDYIVAEPSIMHFVTTSRWLAALRIAKRICNRGRQRNMNRSYTIFVPMPRISAVYPVGYTTDINRREISLGYAAEYTTDNCGLRHKYYIRGIKGPRISMV